MQDDIVSKLKIQRAELVEKINKIDDLIALFQQYPDQALIFDLCRELGLSLNLV